MFSRVQKLWYQTSPLVLLLWPLSLVYCAGVRLRRAAYRVGLLQRQRLAVPVIVVGNITVGGTGKTPLVHWLARFLREQGYQPALVARGYGGRARDWPQQVDKHSDPSMVGDESVWLAGATQCPMAVGPDRVAAARTLLEHHACNVIVSDDGLQHYRLARDIEIAVVDGVQRTGNGFCLPAGPLREPVQRLQLTDIQVVNGLAGRGEYAMQIIITGVASLIEPDEVRPLSAFRFQRIHALAGIGNPKRFFDCLKEAQLEIIEHPFPDHHPFRPSDLEFGDDLPVLMTQKDAVKCTRFARSGWWATHTKVEMDSRFGEHLVALLAQRKPQD